MVFIATVPLQMPRFGTLLRCSSLVLVLQKHLFMTKNQSLPKYLSKWITLISVLLLAFSEQDRFMELYRFANGRAGAKFRSSDDNIIGGLKSGTQGEILERVFFKDTTQNWGLKIRVLGGENKDHEFWVYFTHENPNMKFFKDNPTHALPQITQNPSEAKATELTKDQKAIKDEPAKQIPLQESQSQSGSIREAKSGIIPQASDHIKQESVYKASQEVARIIPAKMEQLNESVSKLNPGHQQMLCNHCDQNLPKSCNSKNGYFEEDLIELQSNGSEFLQGLIQPVDREFDQRGIDLKCVRASLESFPPNRFRKCVPSNGHRLVIEKAQKPCVTDRLAATLTKSFNITAKCLQPVLNQTGDYNYKLQKIFEMISIESGFHTNVIGTNDDAGIGQMQGPAAAAVNRMIIDEAKDSLRHSSHSDCRSLYNEFLKDDEPIKPSKTCDRISPRKGNPWKNMIYTFLYFKVNRDILNDMIFEQDAYSDRLKMSANELEKLKDEMAKLAHNRGAGGAADILSTHLVRNFSSGFPARNTQEVLRTLNSIRNNYLKKSAAQADTVKDLAHLSPEESCIKPF